MMIEINKSNYKNYDYRDIVAFSCASPGAMGDRGAVVIVTTEGCVYHTNPYFGDMTEEEVFQICPPLKECHFGVFGGGEIPEGWHSFYLGGGNHLVVNDVIVPQFLEITEKEVNQKGGYLYNKWLEIVLRLSMSILMTTRRKKIDRIFWSIIGFLLYLFARETSITNRFLLNERVYTL